MRFAAIFDLDGTLVDTPRAIVEGFTVAFERMGLVARDPAAIAATIGLPLEQAFSRLLDVPLDDARVAQGIGEYRVEFQERIVPRAADLVFPGVSDGLAVLRGPGLALAVATSKFHASADALLRSAGLRDRFDLVIGADQVTNAKPHPEMLEVIVRTLGVPPTRAVVVGDTTHDLLMARAAGMRSVAVTYGVHGRDELMSVQPTWVVDTFEDVVRCIQTCCVTDGSGDHERYDDRVKADRSAAG
jgi:phosphoglycolate phosphatase